jgi:uncharacterized protein (DUF1778 family)
MSLRDGLTIDKMSKRKPSIEVYMTDEQKIAIKKAAASCRLSISDYCIEMIFKGHVVSHFSPEEMKLMVQLTGMANNLNQAMKRAHQDKASTIRMDELQNIIEKISSLLK